MEMGLSGFFSLRRSQVMHCFHCCLFITLCYYFKHFICSSDCWRLSPIPEDETLSANVSFIVYVVYLYRCLGMCGFLTVIMLYTLGLLLFNAFETEVETKVDPAHAQFLCFRIVTRGLYPRLVIRNVKALKVLCMRMGLKRFVIQVATDLPIDLEEDRFVKHTHVPETYQTKSGAQFKARALQYCLDHDNVNLEDKDWIVHLDEETIPTRNSIQGIINFAADGRYQFGQGLITYINENVTNWMTSLIEAWRVTDDMGKQRAQLNLFNRLILEWKGSFFVSQAGAEKAVHFDHGYDSSITEDGHFGLLGSQMNYKFHFIEGNMWEESPGSIWDMLQQRKRWIMGGFGILRSKKLNWNTKFFFACQMYGMMFTVGGLIPGILNLFFPTPVPTIVDVFYNFLLFVSLYYQSYGVILSFLLYPRRGCIEFFLCLVASWLLLIPNFIIGMLSCVMALFNTKREGFYIVKKE